MARLLTAIPLLASLTLCGVAGATTLPPAADAPLPARKTELPPPAASWPERSLFEAPRRIEVSERIACLTRLKPGESADCG